MKPNQKLKNMLKDTDPELIDKLKENIRQQIYNQEKDSIKEQVLKELGADPTNLQI